MSRSLAVSCAGVTCILGWDVVARDTELSLSLRNLFFCSLVLFHNYRLPSIWLERVVYWVFQWELSLQTDGKCSAAVAFCMICNHVSIHSLHRVSLISETFANCGARARCRISPPRFLAECCKRVVLFCCILGCLRFLICIEFVYLYFPVLFCLSVSVKWLAVKTASEMTYIVSSGALNSTASI